MYELQYDIYNVTLHVFSMKEEDCVIIIMSIHTKNEQVGDEKFRTIGGMWISFKYPKTVQNNYHNRGAVNSHNSRCQENIVLEDTRSTR